MPTEPHLGTPDTRHADNRLLEALQRSRDGGADHFAPVAGARVDVATARIEQAKGALMLHYGIDSCQALGLLVGWARVTHTPVPIVAHTLLRGICEGNPQTEARHRQLVRWLEAQLRDGDPGVTQLPLPPVRPRRDSETPRSRTERG